MLQSVFRVQCSVIVVQHFVPMGPQPRAENSRTWPEEVQVVLPAIAEQEKFHLKGEVYSDKALEQLFRYLYPGDTQHVDLLCIALARFTPATLCYMYHWGLAKFLQEMAPGLDTLGLGLSTVQKRT